MKIFTKCDILEGCGETGIKLIFKYWNGESFSDNIQNHFTHMLSQLSLLGGNAHSTIDNQDVSVW